MTPPTKQTRTGSVSLREDGIIHVLVLPGIKETKADAQESLRACMEVSGGKRRPVLVDLRQMQAQERDAREVYRGPETAQFGSAVALLVESRISKLIANFFMAIVKPRIVIKIFTDEAEAVTWLKGFRE